MPKTDTETGAPPFPPITLVEEEWLEDFNDFDGSDAEKLEMIRALWSMMLTWADICRSLPSHQETSGQPIQLTELLRRAVLQSNEEETPACVARPGQTKNTQEDV